MEINKKEILNLVIQEYFNVSIDDWNLLTEEEKRNLILKYEMFNKTTMECFNMSAIEWKKLCEDEKQKLIASYHKKHKDPFHNKKTVEIQNGMISYVKKGEKVWISGEGYVYAGLTKEESFEKNLYNLESHYYGKPKALVRKIFRKIKK